MMLERETSPRTYQREVALVCFPLYRDETHQFVLVARHAFHCFRLLPLCPRVGLRYGKNLRNRPVTYSNRYRHCIKIGHQAAVVA